MRLNYPSGIWCWDSNSWPRVSSHNPSKPGFQLLYLRLFGVVTKNTTLLYLKNNSNENFSCAAVEIDYQSGLLLYLFQLFCTPLQVLLSSSLISPHHHTQQLHLSSTCSLSPTLSPCLSCEHASKSSFCKLSKYFALNIPSFVALSSSHPYLPTAA